MLKICRQEWARNNPDRKDCFLQAKLIVSKDGLQKWECVNCENAFALSEVQCDHILPIANTVPQTMEEFLESFKRLHSVNLQILCKNCHKLKTKSDMYAKKYREAMYLITTHLEMSPSFIENNLKDWKVIQKFEKTLRNIEQYSLLRTVKQGEEKFQKYTKQLNKLKEKYL